MENTISPPVAILVAIAFLVIVAVLWWKEQQQKAELHKGGVTVTAHITEHIHETQTNNAATPDFPNDPADNSAPKTTDVYYVSYQYSVNGNIYTHRQSVDRATFEALRHGQAIEVVYLPESPSAARMASLL